MEVLESSLRGPLLLRPPTHADRRGFLQESFRRDAWREAGIAHDFVQENHSRSAQGVVRGMHFQVGAGQAKLVRCVRGSILDVLVDLRRGSPAFGRWQAFRLDDERLAQLYCPIGFAHGFCVTSDCADVVYKLSAYYDAALERGIAWNDPDVGIEWPKELDLTVSERDASAPLLRDVAEELPFEYGG